MEGRAAAWLQLASRNSLLSSWLEFVKAVRHRFGPAIYEDIEGNLSKLIQTSLVYDFQVAFEDLMNKVIGISKPPFVSFFIIGSKPAIRHELFNRPSTLMGTFSLTRAYEAHKEDILSSGFTGSQKTQPNPYNQATLAQHFPSQRLISYA